MDYERAQRNLLLLQDNPQSQTCSVDNSLKVLNPEAKSDDIPSSLDIDTQVPDLDLFSSAPSPPNASDGKHIKSEASSPTTSKNSPKGSIVESNEYDGNINQSTENILISTQIQARLDEEEQNQASKSLLQQFSYSKGVLTPPPVRKKTGSSTKRAYTKKVSKYSSTKKQENALKSQEILMQLSGKHSKVKDMLRRRKLKSADTKSSRIRKKSKTPPFEIYNANEWIYILDLIMKEFPRSCYKDIEEIYNELYGEKPDTQKLLSDVKQFKLWNESQVPPPGESVNTLMQTESCLVPETPEQLVSFVTLSQALDDHSLEHIDAGLSEKGNNGAQYQHENIDYTPDNDGSTILIPSEKGSHKIHVFSSPANATSEYTKGQSDSSVLSSAVRQTEERELTQVGIKTKLSPDLTSDVIKSTGKSELYDTEPRLPLGSGSVREEGIIDLTQGSFDAIEEYISPVRQECNPTVEVPATRTSTVAGNQSEPSTTMRYKLNSKDSKNIFVLDPVTMKSKECIIVSDSEDEHDHDCSILEINTEVASHDHSHNSQDASQELLSQPLPILRENLRKLGLKKSRSKSIIAERVDIVLQTLKSPSSTNSSPLKLLNTTAKDDIFANLNETVMKIEPLMTKIYCMMPIRLPELVTEMSLRNPMISVLDESTIREWADQEGICIRSEDKNI